MLIQRLSDAFGAAAYPGDQAIVYDGGAAHLECCATRQAFSGKCWQDLDLEFLMKHHAALRFFTPEGYRYYLPAYMRASIEHYDRSDLLPSLIIWSLIPPSIASPEMERFYECVNMFTSTQAEMVCLFLRFMLRFHGDDFSDGSIELALKGYWERFCAAEDLH